MKFHALSNDGLTFEIGRWEVGATGIDDAAVGPWYQCHMCRLLYQSRGGYSIDLGSEGEGIGIVYSDGRRKIKWREDQ